MRAVFNSKTTLDLVADKSLVIPQGGWNARQFALHGTGALITMTRLARYTQSKQGKIIAQRVAALINRQVREVVNYVLGEPKAIFSPLKIKPVTIDFMFPQHEQLWAAAIQEVFKDADVEVINELLPPIQSIMGQAYSRVGVILGQQTETETSRVISQLARGIAQQVTKINQTTRNILETTIRNSIGEGLTVSQTANQILEVMPGITGNRAITIARTESNNAWTQGAAESLKQSTTCTHISIIGCQAREENSPQYKGESTCNIEDVAIGELDDLVEVGWHINHTGTLVPSRFREDDGTVDVDGDRPDLLDAQSQAVE